MSLDFYLEGEEIEEECICSCCDNVHIRKYHPKLLDVNITHNLGAMAEEAGIYRCLWRPEELGITKANQMIVYLKLALKDLRNRPEYFYKFTPVNGWGTYSGFVSAVDAILQGCIEYPASNIKVCR